MKNLFQVSLLGIALLGSAPAAARTITVDVVRFHSGLAPTGQTIALQPSDPALATSIEFSNYANGIGARLEKLGFKPATAGAKADLVGLISYSQTERQTIRDGSRSGVTIGIGVGTFGSHGGVSVGGSVPVGGSDSGSSKDMIRTTTLELSLKRPGDTVAIWEGRTSTEGRAAKDNALPEMIPVLTEALLTDFPGTSGKTARVKVKSPAKR